MCQGKLLPIFPQKNMPKKKSKVQLFFFKINKNKINFNINRVFKIDCENIIKLF
jgi:hypothetical protein